MIFNLIAPSLVLFALVTALLSTVLNFVIRHYGTSLFARTNRLSPQHRARTYFALLAAPTVIAAAVLTLALGHCVGHHAFGIAEDCNTLRGLGCGFCLFTPGPVGSLTVALAVSFALIALLRMQSVFAGILQGYRATQRLRAVAVKKGDGVWSVPGVSAFVLGWPRAVVCVGEQLEAQLAPEAVLAVTAHEQGHQLRGDVLLRTVARVLSLVHYSSTAKTLLESLDLAIEQACDEHACRLVNDRLLVADALLHAARLQHPGGVSSSLAARIKALCMDDDSNTHTPLWVRWSPVGLLLMLVLGVLASHHIHHAVEVLIHLVNS